MSFGVNVLTLICNFKFVIYNSKLSFLEVLWHINAFRAGKNRYQENP